MEIKHYFHDAANFETGVYAPEKNWQGSSYGHAILLPQGNGSTHCRGL